MLLIFCHGRDGLLKAPLTVQARENRAGSRRESMAKLRQLSVKTRELK